MQLKTVATAFAAVAFGLLLSGGAAPAQRIDPRDSPPSRRRDDRGFEGVHRAAQSIEKNARDLHEEVDEWHISQIHEPDGTTTFFQLPLYLILQLGAVLTGAVDHVDDFRIGPQRLREVECPVDPESPVQTGDARRMRKEIGRRHDRHNRRVPEETAVRLRERKWRAALRDAVALSRPA